MPWRRNLKLFLPSWTFHVTHHGSFAVIEQGSQGVFHADGLVKFSVFLWRCGEVVISLGRRTVSAIKRFFSGTRSFPLCPLLSRSLEIQGTLDRRLPSMRKNSALCFEKIITI